MSTESIKEIVGQYAVADPYGGVEIEEDRNWSTEDLQSLAKAIEKELVGIRNIAITRKISRINWRSL